MTVWKGTGIIANMKATLVTRTRDTRPDGSVVEMVIWEVPVPVPPTTHGFKYRLVYLRNGVRLVGFDNERGKGDHMHLDGQELPYQFVSVAELIADFYREIRKRSSV